MHYGMTLTLYKECDPFICTFIFSLSDSSKIIVFKDLILEIIRLKVTKKSKKKSFSMTLSD